MICLAKISVSIILLSVVSFPQNEENKNTNYKFWKWNAMENMEA